MIILSRQRIFHFTNNNDISKLAAKEQPWVIWEYEYSGTCPVVWKNKEILTMPEMGFNTRISLYDGIV